MVWLFFAGGGLLCFLCFCFFDAYPAYGITPKTSVKNDAYLDDLKRELYGDQDKEG